MDSIETPLIEARIARAKALRHALGVFATGVTVVTTEGADGKRHGLTANSFSSVSLDPPMVLWSQSVGAPSHPVFLEAEHFAVNVLSEGQIDLSTRFSRWGEDKFVDVKATSGIGKSPILHGCAATFECSTVYRYPGGDHTIFVGKVERYARTQKRPLIFAEGKYLAGMPLELPETATSLDPGDVSDVRAVRCATPEAMTLARDLQETICLSVWGNHGPTVVRWEQGGRSVSPALRTGLVLPVLTSATGLLLSAYLPGAATLPLMEAEAATDPVARITYECLTAVLAEVRSRGFASIRSSAFPDMYGGDVDAISVPVRNARGDVVLAMTAVKLTGVGEPEWPSKVVSALLEAAARISSALGLKNGHV